MLYVCRDSTLLVRSQERNSLVIRGKIPSAVVSWERQHDSTASSGENHNSFECAFRHVAMYDWHFWNWSMTDNASMFFQTHIWTFLWTRNRWMISSIILRDVSKCMKVHVTAADQSDWPLEERIVPILGAKNNYLQLNSCISKYMSLTKKKTLLIFYIWQVHALLSNLTPSAASGPPDTQRAKKRISHLSHPKMQLCLPAWRSYLQESPNQTKCWHTWRNWWVHTGFSRTWQLLAHCISGCHTCVLLNQDEAAKEMHNENKVMKKQLIGLLAKVKISILYI